MLNDIQEDFEAPIVAKERYRQQRLIPAAMEGVINLTNADRITALEAQVERLTADKAGLVEEVENLRKRFAPQWFYLAGDTSSDKCRFSVEASHTQC